MEKLQLISLWNAKKTKDSYVNFHSHKYNELVYYPKGNGITKIGKEEFVFSDNCLAVIPKNTEHNEFHYSDSEVICLEFIGINDLKLSLIKDSSNIIHKILKEMLREVENQKYGYKEMLTIKLKELLINIMRSENNTTETKNFEYIINYIKENFHEHIILSDCAKQLNISYDYFQHKFKTITGCAPQQYLIDQRLTASKKMLKDSELNCTEIAYRCGFCTSAQFTSLFKKKYGITPKQFRCL